MLITSIPEYRIYEYLVEQEGLSEKQASRYVEAARAKLIEIGNQDLTYARGVLLSRTEKNLAKAELAEDPKYAHKFLESQIKLYQTSLRYPKEGTPDVSASSPAEPSIAPELETVIRSLEDDSIDG
jgi:hypothetical protein